MGRTGRARWCSHPRALVSRRAPARLRFAGRQAGASAVALTACCAVVPPPEAPTERPAVRVVTVDDYARFLVLARRVVEATPGFELAGEASCGADGVALAE